MKSVLLAWELGEGLGHVARLRSVARELAAHGHRPVFAVRDVVGSGALVKDEGFPVLQAPIWAKRMPRQPFGAASYADILASHGFANADDLAQMVLAWQDLFDLVKPDLMVADHSPTACLAAYGAVPVALIGSGFTLPPADLPEFPALRPEVPPIALQVRLLEVVHEVQRRRKRPALETLPRLLDSPVRSVCTFPELDPYAGVRSEPVIGPLEPLPAPVPLPTEPGLYAYCAAEFTAIEDLILCLAEMDVPVSIHIRGGAGSLARFLEGRGIHVYDEPPPLTEVLPKVSAILHHGGNLTAHAGLTAGRPQVVLPQHLEAKLTARALEWMEVCKTLRRVDKPEDLTEALRQILHEARWRDRAQFWSERIADRGVGNALERTVEGCLRLVS